jgi:hypothetical protein
MMLATGWSLKAGKRQNWTEACLIAPVLGKYCESDAGTAS